MATSTSRYGFRLPDPTDLVSVTTDINDAMSKIDAALDIQIVTAFPAAPKKGAGVAFSNDSYRSFFHNGTAPASGGWVEVLNSSGTFASDIKLNAANKIVIGTSGGVNLYRSAADILRTDDTFSAGNGVLLSDQGDPSTPAAGTHIHYSFQGTSRWRSPNGDIYDASGSNRDDLMSPSASYETMSRIFIWASNAITSGQLNIQPVWLPKGFVVSNLIWHNGVTAGGTLTNQWAALYDSSRVQLAVTGNKTTTAVPANTKFTWAIAATAAGAASSFTTTYAGLYYVGLMIAATTTPSPTGASTVGNSNLTAPIFGVSDTAQTTVPAFPHTATAPSVAGARYHYMVVA